MFDSFRQLSFITHRISYQIILLGVLKGIMAVKEFLSNPKHMYISPCNQYICHKFREHIGMLLQSKPLHFGTEDLCYRGTVG